MVYGLFTPDQKKKGRLPLARTLLSNRDRTLVCIRVWKVVELVVWYFQENKKKKGKGQMLSVPGTCTVQVAFTAKSKPQTFIKGPKCPCLDEKSIDGYD